jgi:hypothetical protein
MADIPSAQEDSKMRTRSHASIALCAGLALGIGTLATGARAADASEPSTQASPASGQQRVADATLKLENAFSDQFARGKIDRTSLAGPIGEVLDAMPEAARPRVKEHIELVLQNGERLASQMTPEQRADAVTPPQAESVGKTAQAQVVAGWGWGGMAGFGGFGAFGFPMMGFGGWGWGW